MATDARLLSSPKNCLWPNGSHLLAPGTAGAHDELTWGAKDQHTCVTCGASHCPELLTEEADSIFQPRALLDCWVKMPGSALRRRGCLLFPDHCGTRIQVLTVRQGYPHWGGQSSSHQPVQPRRALPCRRRPCCCHTSCPDPRRYVALTPGLCWRKT